MDTAPHASVISVSQLDRLREGREIVAAEGKALLELSRRLDAGFCDAVQRVLDCRGDVIVCGIGKAGLIGRKIAATLSSTGTRAHFLHPAEAVHGDLGSLDRNDLFLALSNSGETEELCRLLPVVREMELAIVAVTSTRRSTLGRQADATIELGQLSETGLHGLAPSTSTAALLAVGDALALVVSRVKEFTPEQFAVFHPGGSLGRRLAGVREIMRGEAQLRISPQDATIREMLIAVGRPGRRSGAVMLVDGAGRLTGVFTDSDLSRLLEERRDQQLDRPISEVMTANPLTIPAEASLAEAVALLKGRRISELPVVDASRRPVGMIDITDVVALLPAGQEWWKQSA